MALFFRMKMREFVPHSEKVSFIRILCSGMTILLLFSSCSSECKCKEESCKPCPDTVYCTNKVQLNQLDTASRDRLKSELLSEIKEETRQQWKQEFEAEQTKLAFAAPQNSDNPPEKAEYPKVAPEPLPPTQKIERDAGGIKILRISFTTQIVHRLPVDERDAFSVSDASVICFAEISAANAEDRSITIKFTHSTGLTQSYTLPVSQSPAWRTWSKLNLTKAMTGTWLCEIFNEDDVLLASRPFVVVD